MKDKYVVQVAPLIPLPLNRTQVFSYLSNKPLSAGTLVIVSFFRRTLEGIVVSSKKDFPRRGGIELKKINQVLEEGYLAEWQIELARKLSGYYLSPWGLFLKLMVPKKMSNVKWQKSKVKKIILKNKLPGSEEAKNILQNKSKKFLVVGSARKRLDLNLSLVSSVIKSKKQCLILVPEIYLACETQKYFQKAFPGEEIALLHGKIPKGQFFDQWKKIKSGEIKIIAATKLGVFLPFLDLGLVIVEEEQDISHKQWDMSPRYNAARAAEFLAQGQSAKLIGGNTILPVEAGWQAQKRKWPIFYLEKKGERDIQPEIVDLFEERKKPDFPISKILYENIARSLNQKKKILLLAKRRGYSMFSVCQNCKSVLKCARCDRALVYFEETGDYRCLHCSFRAELLGFCPSCGGFQFSHLGAGTQLVEKRIKTLFPSARVARWDADSLKNLKKYQEIGGRLANGEIDIIIGTQMILKLGGFFDFDLVGIVSAHDFLSIADFNSTERALASFTQARNLSGEKGRLIVQTFSPRQEIFSYLQSGNYRKFFENDISSRKRFSYPPFSKLIKLSFRDNSKKKAQKETRQIFDLLAATGNNETEISEPYEPLASQKRGYFYVNILVKTKPEQDVIRLGLNSIIGGLKKGWTVDVDPIGTV